MSTPSTFHLVADHISVKYAQEHILQDISLSLPGKSVIGLSGASGSGKSTLLRVLSGIQAPNTGSLIYQVNDIQTPFKSQDGILIPQKALLLEHATVLQNCMVTALAQGMAYQVVYERACQLLAQLGLLAYKDKPAQTLSGGQQQRLSWIRAALMQRPVICADEPTAHLDTQAARLCIPFFRTCANTGSLVIIASHDPAILQQCDHVYYLSHGVMA
jgi:ABC-type lipoprotein export system ATPase subunit